MNGEFKEFSQETHLYAQYSRVVDQMEEIFLNDISAFLSAVRIRMQTKLDAGQIEEEQTKKYRSWYIEDEDTKNNETPPYVWLERRRPEIIVPGVLTVVADTHANESERRQLAACKASLALPSHCRFLDRGLFAVSITYGDRDPVEATVDPILAVLVRLHEAEKALLSARTKAARQGKVKGKETR